MRKELALQRFYQKLTKKILNNEPVVFPLDNTRGLIEEFLLLCQIISLLKTSALIVYFAKKKHQQQRFRFFFFHYFFP